MKKVLLSLMLVASVSVGVFAQQKSKGCSSDGKCKMSQDLNLTSEQQEKMKALSQDFKTKNDNLRGQQKELRTKYQASVKSILTPEQQAKWEKNADKRSKRDHKGGKNIAHNKNRGGKKMNLDAATTTKLADLRSNFEKEKKAVEMSRIAPEVQKERVKSLKDKYRNDRKEIIKKANPQNDKKKVA